MTQAALAPDVPSAGQLRRWQRRARQAHGGRSLRDTASELYMMVLFVAIYGGVVANALSHRPPLTGADPALIPERSWLLAGVLVAAAGAAWRGLSAIGPLLATPAVQTWSLSTPVDRRGWLRPRLAGLLVAAAGVGAAAGAALVTAGGHHHDIGTLTTGALGGAAYAVAFAALSVVAQAAPPRRWIARCGIALSLAGVVAVAAVLLLHPTRPIRLGAVLSPLPVALGVALAVGAVIAAGKGLRGLDRARLSAGASLASAAVSAVLWLDLSLLSAALEARRWRQVGRVRGWRIWRGGRTWVLLQAEARRLTRRPAELGAWAALLLVPYAAASFSPTIAGILRVVAAYVAAGRLAAGLRAISGSPALRRALGGSDGQLRVTHLVAPGLGLALWWLLTWPAAPVPSVLAVVFPAGTLAAVYRAATRPPMSYGGAALDTGFGLIPVDLLRQLARGPDVVALLVVVELVVAAHL